MEYYVRIDEKEFLSNGDICIVGKPKTLMELFGEEFEKMPNKGFRIHRPDVFYNFIEVIGGKRGKVASYILRNKDPRNILLRRVQDLAEDAGVSLQTANDTLRVLRESNSIKTITSAIMVNPGVDHSGDRQRESFLMRMYQEFERRKKEDFVEE